MRFFRIVNGLILSALIFFNTASAATQNDDTCPKLVDEAVALTSKVCQQVGRNQVCYGNLDLTAQPRSDAVRLRFEKPGDIAPLKDIASLTLSPMDTRRQIWGVSLMKVQANLPDTLPGQNVTVVLFGDVELRPAIPAELAGKVRAGAAINLRAGASKTEAVIGSLAGGTAITLNGRSTAGDWLRVKLTDGKIGWVSKALVGLEGDAATLDVVDNTASGTLQAFYLRTGVGDATCKKAPSSGIVIQTPQGAGEIALRINQADIRLGSTAYMEASEESGLQVFTLDGHAKVRAKGSTQTVMTGNRTTVALDANLAAAQAPTTPTAYTAQEVAGVAAPLEIIAPDHLNILFFSECATGNGPMFAGQHIALAQGNGCWNTREEAQAALDGHTSSVWIDGVQIPNTTHPVEASTCAGAGVERYTAGIQAGWTAVAGTHTFRVTWNGPIMNYEFVCTATVFE